MTVHGRIQKGKLEEVLSRAVEFHGHLGPFLVLGVKMGLIGLRELRVNVGNSGLDVTVVTKPSVPFSCIIDGLQVATQCTVGNGKLKILDSPKIIAAKFRILNNSVVVTLNPAMQKKLEKAVLEEARREKMESIARWMLSTPEKELFKVEKKQLLWNQPRNQIAE